MEALRDAKRTGSRIALSRAEKALDRALTKPVAQDRRARVFELAEALFQSIRMQLSVERYGALRGRGNNLDTIDAPLNNRLWLEDQFEAIRKLDTEVSRLERIQALVNWTDPGPGGFYDDLGDPSAQPHLVRGKGFERDPEGFDTVLCHFEDLPRGRKSWQTQALALYDASLTLRYTGLNRSASYKVRVVYGAGPMSLTANGKTEIHAELTKRYEPLEFDIPPDATRDGQLWLSWRGKPGIGGAGRGCQVCEVWLIRK
jgi:hypothetical protein